MLVFLGFINSYRIAFLHFQFDIMFKMSYKVLLLNIIITIIITMDIINIFIISITIISITTHVSSGIVTFVY